MNAYSHYKIGDTFYNDNGETYFIIALDEKKDKAILGKVAADGTPFYIGAQGLDMTCWRYGHYFMQNIFAAVDWYKNDDSKQEKSDCRPTVGGILEKIVDYRKMDIYIDDHCKQLTFCFKGNQIPHGFLRCHVDKIECDRITFIVDSSTEQDLDMDEIIDIYYKSILNF